ncbi:MAG: hypothetical protein K2Q22_17885 [Cytophagales bacterium]|nr:hypothetical protein [Cytophagales bacterium]
MKYAELDTSNYPIVISKTNPIDPSPQQIDEYFNEIETYLDNTSGSYVFISYSDESKFISSEARIHIGKLAGKLTEKFKSRNKGSIIVSNGVVAQMMLKGISLVYKPLQDNIIVKSLDEAKVKAKELLK